MGLVAFVITAGTAIQLLGRSEGSPGPDAAQLEWLQVVDRLAAQGDCAALQDHVGPVAADLGIPGTEQHSRNAVFLQYSDDAMRRIGCRIVEPITRRVTGPFASSGKSARH
jgi:hypothetical protein